MENHHHHRQLCYVDEANLPPGFRFHPTDEELISYYLLKKVLDCNFTTRAIAQVDLNKCEPWNLPGKAKMGEKEWYFFSLRDRKYPTGVRTNRATEGGYWKATGKDREIYSTKTWSLVGMKKTLVFYRGRAPKGEKTNWVMHEYRLQGKLAYHYLSAANSQDEWVISRVFQKTAPGSSSATVGGATKKRPSAGFLDSSTLISQVHVTSPSSVSLPPLAASSAKEHVPCFSTTTAPGFSQDSLFELPPPPSSSLNSVVHGLSSASLFGKHGVGVSAFPSLRSLQENLHLPHFFSTAAPPHMHDDACQMPSYSSVGQWPALDNEKMCASELNCIWG